MVAVQPAAAADEPRGIRETKGPRAGLAAERQQRLAMSSTNGNKGELAVRLPISVKQLAPQMGVSVAQLVSDLTFKLKVHGASINMDVPSDVVVALAELHNLRVKVLRGDDGVGS